MLVGRENADHMLVAQISDLHIKAGTGGKENSRRLRHVVEYLLAVPFVPDIVVVSGDMTEDGAELSYEVLRDILAPLRIPTLFAVGNHDRRAALRSVFPKVPFNDGFVQYAVEFEDRRILVLDTLEEGRDDGAFCSRRVDWLRTTLDARTETETMIVLHHPPARTSIDWMDVHPGDAWTERLAGVIRDHPQVIALIAGHVHRPIAMTWQGRVLTTTTSTAPQVALDLRPIDPACPDGRPLIVDEPPGLAFHRWTSTGIATHFDVIDQPETIVRFDRHHRAMIEELTRMQPSD